MGDRSSSTDVAKWLSIAKLVVKHCDKLLGKKKSGDYASDWKPQSSKSIVANLPAIHFFSHVCPEEDGVRELTIIDQSFLHEVACARRLFGFSKNSYSTSRFLKRVHPAWIPKASSAFVLVERVGIAFNTIMLDCGDPTWMQALTPKSKLTSDQFQQVGFLFGRIRSVEPPFYSIDSDLEAEAKAVEDFRRQARRDDDYEWMGPKSPSEWEKIFGRTWQTIAASIRRGIVIGEKVHSKLWRIRSDSLPRSPLDALTPRKSENPL